MATPEEVLAQVPLFSMLPKKELAKLARHARDRTFPAGAVLTDEQETAVSFGVIVEGRAAVSVHGRPVRTLGPGDYFGEMALIDNSHQSAKITAETELRCLLFVAWVFRPFAIEHPETAWALLEMMVQRVRDAEARQKDQGEVTGYSRYCPAGCWCGVRSPRTAGSLAATTGGPYRIRQSERLQRSTSPSYNGKYSAIIRRSGRMTHRLGVTFCDNSCSPAGHARAEGGSCCCRLDRRSAAGRVGLGISVLYSGDHVVVAGRCRARGRQSWMKTMVTG